jgi:hypothetical protein
MNTCPQVFITLILLSKEDVKAQESASKNNNISYAPNLQGKDMKNIIKMLDIDIRGSILLKPNDQVSQR